MHITCFITGDPISCVVSAGKLCVREGTGRKGICGGGEVGPCASHIKSCDVAVGSQGLFVLGVGCDYGWGWG